MEISAKGWGFMLESWLNPEPMVTVNTNSSIVAIVMPVVLNITGGFKDENNAVLNNIAFIVHLNEDKKCVKEYACWDNNEPALKAAIAKVGKKLEAAKKVSHGVAADSPMAGMVTGQ
mmetsp:Transcript_25768/g.42232  ORF Transcript_25768/g.42232 Transcript_25768/m.42232 type:complete len:117 (-) Transcript_25768:172-522(-)